MVIPQPDLFETMSTMRTMRRLEPEQVPRELLERLVQAATWAPSGGNTQTVRYVVVDDRTQIARIAPLWRRVHQWYVTGQGGANPPTFSTEQWTRTLDATQYLADHFEDVPALIAVCNDMSEVRSRTLALGVPMANAFRKLGARHGATAARNLLTFTRRSVAASAYPAAENLLLAARGCGLAASLTTWHLLFDQELKTILGIPGHLDTYALIPLGYPIGRFGPVSRRPVSEFLHWNHW
jgi:nitroreductase